MTDALQLLRPGLLDGRAVVHAGPARAAVTGALAGLGAAVRPLEADLADEGALDLAAALLAPVDVLVADAAALFAAPAEDELGPLRAAADGTWAAVRAIANAAWIEPRCPGRVTLLAPRPGDGPHAEAARAALENLARTLSIEWARHGIRTVAITPGTQTSDAEVATVAAYLASPAGDYFSGCRLDLS